VIIRDSVSLTGSFDREFGEQTFSSASEFPFASDPSLWGTLELVRLNRRFVSVVALEDRQDLPIWSWSSTSTSHCRTVPDTSRQIDGHAAGQYFQQPVAGGYLASLVDQALADVNRNVRKAQIGSTSSWRARFTVKRLSDS